MHPFASIEIENSVASSMDYEFLFVSNPDDITERILILTMYRICNQCWGKLLLKVMHYIIALRPKKVLIMFLSYFLWKVSPYVTFQLLFKSGQGLLVCFLYKKVILQM